MGEFDLTQWCDTAQLNNDTEQKLICNGISTMDDLISLSFEDLIEMNITIAQRNRIGNVLENCRRGAPRPSAG